MRQKEEKLMIVERESKSLENFRYVNSGKMLELMLFGELYVS